MSGIYGVYKAYCVLVRCRNIWDKVFNNGPSKICGREPLKNLKGYGLLKATATTTSTLYIRSTGVTLKRASSRLQRRSQIVVEKNFFGTFF